MKNPLLFPRLILGLAFALVLCSMPLVAGAMDDEPGGPGPAGCDDDPHLCSQPDPDQTPPSGYDQECYSCDTWDFGCATSLWEVCSASDPDQGPSLVECLTICGTLDCDYGPLGEVTCPSRDQCGVRNQVHPDCRGGLHTAIDCTRDACGNWVPFN